MADVERRIELYLLSFNLVRPYIEQLEVHAPRSDVGLKLHEAIRREISLGLTDAVKVAENAVRSVQKAYHRNHV